jgi:hypothetical protein
MSKNSSRQNLEAVKAWVKFMDYKYPQRKHRRKEAARLAMLKEQNGYSF